MDEKTKEALDGSITKWEDIVAGKGLDAGPDNCPLCTIFFNEQDCGDCPVRLETGFGGCVNTPYTKWYNHHDFGHGDVVSRYEGLRIIKECSICLERAQAEVDFLKSLREDG